MAVQRRAVGHARQAHEAEVARLHLVGPHAQQVPHCVLRANAATADPVQLLRVHVRVAVVLDALHHPVRSAHLAGLRELAERRREGGGAGAELGDAQRVSCDGAVALLAAQAAPRLAGPCLQAPGRPVAAHQNHTGTVERRAAAVAANHLAVSLAMAAPAPADEPGVRPAAHRRHEDPSATIVDLPLRLARAAVVVWRLFGGGPQQLQLLRHGSPAAPRCDLGLELLDPQTLRGILCAEPLPFELCGLAPGLRVDDDT